MVDEGSGDVGSGESTANTGTIDRRSVLGGLAAAGVAGVGLTATTGTASAAEEQCLFMRDAPDDFPVVEWTEDGYEPVSGSVRYDEDELLLYVHGWIEKLAGGAADQGYTTKLALEDAGYDYPTATVKWPSNTLNPQSSFDDANAAGETLAAEIEEIQGLQPDLTIRIVAHSLGARVALTCLEELTAIDADPVDSVALLGGAVVRSAVTVDGEFGSAIADGADEVHNYYSQSDAIIDHLFELGNGKEGIGAEGAKAGVETPDNYDDFDVTDTVKGHCIYFKPENGCMDRVVDGFDSDVEGDGPVEDDGWWPF